MSKITATIKIGDEYCFVPENGDIDTIINTLFAAILPEANNKMKVERFNKQGYFALVRAMITNYCGFEFSEIKPEYTDHFYQLFENGKISTIREME